MDLNRIQALIDFLKNNGVKKFSHKDVDSSEISLEFHSEGEFSAEPTERPAPKTHINTHVPSASSPVSSTPAHKGQIVGAEMVGTIYLSMSPQKPKFVEVGTQVRKGQTLCLIEAMKTYFEVKSPVDGTVEKIFIHEKETVDFGKPLFSIIRAVE